MPTTLEVKTPQPGDGPAGPNAKRVIEQARNTFHCRTHGIIRWWRSAAAAPWSEDVDGNVFLDFAAGIAVAPRGTASRSGPPRFRSKPRN